LKLFIRLAPRCHVAPVEICGVTPTVEADAYDRSTPRLLMAVEQGV
jgi:hypothetical protein